MKKLVKEGQRVLGHDNEVCTNKNCFCFIHSQASKYPSAPTAIINNTINSYEAPGVSFLLIRWSGFFIMILTKVLVYASLGKTFTLCWILIFFLIIICLVVNIVLLFCRWVKFWKWRKPTVLVTRTSVPLVLASEKHQR